MSKELEKMKRMMAQKMGYKQGHRVKMPSKGAAEEFFRAKVNKERLPQHEYPHSRKDPKFARMSIEEFEKKYQ